MAKRKPPVLPAPPAPSEEEELDVALIILRAALRWKQKDLAQASGIGNSSISDYERRKKSPGRRNLRKILESMGYRESVLEAIRWFLNELRTTHRLAPGESVDAPGEPLPLGAAGLQARIDQVTGEFGRASEQVVRLVLEILTQAGRAPEEGG